MSRNRVVCHYTSLESFIKILESQQLWATSLLQVNDKSELTSFVDYIEEQIVKFDINENHSKNKEKIKVLFKQIRKIMFDEQGYCFVTSFSKLYDDAAQWERYGNNGFGVCIGFNYNKLYGSSIRGNYYLNEVKYHINKNLVTTFYSIIDRKFNEEYFDAICELLLIKAAQHKHKSFMQEKEVRIISSKYFNASYKTRIVNSTIKSYQEIDFTKEPQFKIEDLIEKIIIGPRATFGVNELFSLLSQHNFNISINKIEKSTCPLR